MSTIQQLTVASLTTAVNQILSPNQFLRRLLFGNHSAQPTGTIEVDVLVKAREAAPFVGAGAGAEAFMVPGHSEVFQSITAPNCRIKRPFTPSELLEGRRPGATIFPTTSDLNAMIEQHIARDLQVMSDMEINSEELLISQALQGKISYQVADQANFQITFPRAAANVVVLTTFWDDPDFTLPAIEKDFMSAKRIISLAVNLQPTDVILGQEASDAFIRLLRKQFPFGLSGNGRDYGDVEFQNAFSEDGAIYLGRFAGLRVWEYSRVVLVNGVSTPMIRSKYAEFVTNTPAAENVLYFGAIPDAQSFGSGVAQIGERFSKQWVTPDPSIMWALLHSRPLPVPRRPNSTVSMKVVSG